MKNLFNNPWVIVCLGIFSVIYMVITIGGLILEEEALANVPIDMDTSYSTSSSFNARQAFDTDKSGITWLDSVSRDPFGAVEPPSEGLGDNALTMKKTPRLDAIFFGENRRMAVVDQQLIREGETIGQYRVIAIKRNQVILAWDKKRLVLETLL